MCSDAGTIRKTLKVDGMPDKTGFFFNMSNAQVEFFFFAFYDYHINSI